MSQNIDLVSRINGLADQLHKSEGTRIRRALRPVEMAYQMFMGNRRDLVEAIDEYRGPEYSRITVTNQSHDAFLIDVLRRLHNFATSVKTLVEQTRPVIRTLYSGTAFESEYQDHMKRTFETPLAQFVQGLRNYILHSDHPRILGHAGITYPGNTPTTDIKLDLGALVMWDGWNAHAREYLKENIGSVPLRDIVEEYSSLVEGFHSWLQKRQDQIHTEAFAERSRLLLEIRQLQALRSG